MSRLIASITMDFRVQLKSHMLAGVLIPPMLFGGVMLMLPTGSIPPMALPFVILTGIVTTNMLFSSSLLLKERQTRTLDALRLSPLTVWEYTLSKLVTLSVLSIVEGGVFAIAAIALSPNWPLLVLGIVLASVFLSLIGMIAAAPHQSLVTFLLPSGIACMVALQSPLWCLLTTPDTIGNWLLIPTAIPVNIMASAYDPSLAWPVEQWFLGSVGWSGLLLAGCGFRLRTVYNWR